MAIKSISVSPAVPSNKFSILKEERKETSSSKGTKKGRAFKIVTLFLDQTSLHGLQQVNSNANYVVKALWMVAFLAAFGSNMYHLSTLVQTYLQYPVQEVTSLIQRPSRFPSVTVCNLDPISTSNRQQLLSNKSSDFYKYSERVQRMVDKGLISEYTRRQMKNADFIKMNIRRSEQHELGHHLEDLIVSCKFRGEHCNLTYSFQLLSNSFFYNCYTFDPKERAEDFMSAGVENGLSIILYLENNVGAVENAEYQPEIFNGHAEGARIIIHPHEHFPQAHSEGIDIIPGHSTSIGYRVKEIIKLGGPYDNCFGNLTLEKLVGIRYHPTSCEAKCLTDYFVDRCACKTQWQMFSDLPYYDHIPYCGALRNGSDEEDLLTFETKVGCGYTHWVMVEGNVTLKQALCDCPPRCVDFMYPYSMSMSKWPAAKYLSGFFGYSVRKESKAYRQLHEKFLESQRSPSPDYGFIKDNFARLNVYLEDSLVEHMEQTPSYLLSNLFSDMGGTFGLWIGLSLLTILEVIQLVIELILNMCGKNNVS